MAKKKDKLKILNDAINMLGSEHSDSSDVVCAHNGWMRCPCGLARMIRQMNATADRYRPASQRQCEVTSSASQ